jgi:hypothetical protein
MFCAATYVEKSFLRSLGSFGMLFIFGQHSNSLLLNIVKKRHSVL